MLIQPFPSGPIATNAYVIACPITQAAAIIDPAPNSADAIAKFIAAKQLKPTQILLTHSHWDHIADVAQLKEMYNVPVLIHAADAGNLQTPGSDGLPCYLDITSVYPDAFLKEGDKITIGNYTLNVIETPGYSPGGVCFYCPETNQLISGDTLFRGSMGTLALPTAQPERMWPSLKKLSLLPSQTVVYPGHGPKTTIGQEPWLADAESFFGNI